MKLGNQISFLNNVSFLDKLLFTKHMAMMIKSGIPIAEAIETIASQTTNSAFKKTLNGVLKEINNGQSLEKALSKYPKVFNPLYINLVKIGEQSGNLENNLIYLAEELKKDYDFRKKVQGALMYPTIVIVAAITVGGFTSLFVLPKLVDLFASLNTTLPLSTKILLFLANSMKDYGILIMIGLALLFFGVSVIVNLPKVKPEYHKLLLSLPVFGEFLRNVELTSFCRSLGIMLKSGLVITTALETQKQATTNLVFKKYLEDLQKSTDKGKSLEEELSLAKFKFIPKIVSKMIGVGESTGKLDESLLYLGDFFEDEVDNTTKNLSTILEPILLLGIGMIVAFVAFAIISPIYELTGSLKR